MPILICWTSPASAGALSPSLAGSAMNACSATLLVAAWWWRRRKAGLLERIGYAAIFAGAVGNAVDRAAHGYVVDFIHIAYWPIFNVADIAIVAGALALGVATGVRRRAAT